MGIIIITRHGRYVREPGQNDGHLTPQGRQETEKLVSALPTLFARISSGSIFRSPLMRSLETAEIIQRVLGWNMIQDSRIADPVMDIDLHLNMVHSPVCNPEKLSTGEVYALMRQPQGFETYEEAATRFSGFLQELVKKLGNNAAIVVTHAPTPDYLLLQHFQTGLCWGQDIQYGETLRIRVRGNSIILMFRKERVYANIQSLLFDPKFIHQKRRRRGYEY